MTLKPNEVQIIYNITASDYEGFYRNQIMIYTEVIAGKDNKMSSTHIYCQFKDLVLFKA